MYNKRLAHGILEKLDEEFPRKLHLHELQAELPMHQGLPHDEWLSAVQALRLDGALNGKFLPDGRSIANAAALYITDRGRSRLREPVGHVKSGVDMVSDQMSSRNPQEDQLQVFLCHASGDKEAVRDLYAKLTAEGFRPWLDEENLLPGQDWNSEIRRAVRASHVVVVCLSASSISKEGYVQKEITLALDVADEKPAGTIFLIPARLDVCEVPERLSGWHRVDLYAPRGYERLVAALQARNAQRPRPPEPSGKNRGAGSPEIDHKPKAPLSLAEKMRRSLAEHGQAEDEARARQQRESKQRQTARAVAPEQFETLATLLSAKGDHLNDEKLPKFPPFKYVPVNHRLDAGKFSIELNPYAAIDSYTVRIFVGLHPNAAQFLAELPNIPTREVRLNAAMDRDEFCWRNERGNRLDASQVIENAAEVLCDLILDDIRQRGL